MGVLSNAEAKCARTVVKVKDVEVTAAPCHPGSHSIMGMLKAHHVKDVGGVGLMSPGFSHSWERSQNSSGSAGNVVGNCDCVF